MTATPDHFRALHQDGTFVIPNPWDVGSALILQSLGFRALATTSSGLAASLGKLDQQVTRDELVAHVAAVTAAVDVPVNVDAERGYDDVALTIRLLAEAGAAGVSIEDYDPAESAIVPLELAVSRIAAAAAACARHGIVLTARAENLLYGAGDVDDTVARLVAYREAGAEVLYAPGLRAPADIARVVALGAPVNVLAVAGAPTVPELAELGVRRVSTGGALAWAAYGALRDAGRELLDQGTTTYRDCALTGAELERAIQKR